MSVATTAIVEGSVARVSSRTVKVKAGANAGNEITFTSMFVVGPYTVANVRINTDAFELPKIGAQIRAMVEVSVYRDDDEVSLMEYL